MRSLIARIEKHAVHFFHVARSGAPRGIAPTGCDLIKAPLRQAFATASSPGDARAAPHPARAPDRTLDLGRFPT